MTLPTPLRSSAIKYINRDVIFALMREHRQTTRTELARFAGLSKATVSEIVEVLLQENIIHEVGKHKSGRGRRRVVLEFDPTACLVLGAQLDDQVCSIVLADLDAHPRFRAVRPIQGTELHTFLTAIEQCVTELRLKTQTPILGLGVGSPGSVDPTGRRVTISVSHGWKDVPIADLLEARLQLPVVAANRAKVAALGELWHGTHRGIENLIYVFVGSGIVAGIVVNGSLYFGSSGGAGELGHVTILPDGPICGCGNQGCLHTVASESAILRLARAKARQAGTTTLLNHLTGGTLGQLTLDLVLEAARQGDGVALATLTEVGTYLGMAIANLVNTLNPQVVIIGGPTARLGSLLLDPIGREVRRRALGDLVTGLEIVPSMLGDEAGAIGAAALFLKSLKSISSATTAHEEVLALVS